jgi:iduronate 2-sulfatase
MRQKKGWIQKACLLAWIWMTACAAAAERPNVLFVAVDDLKPMLGSYGVEGMHTPVMDALAARGATFLNAHCQQAVCGPSRASLLTGKRPDRIGIWDLKTKIRKTNPGIVTLPEYFRKNGYETVGIGKIYDPRSVDGRAKHDAASWSVPYTPSWNMDYNPQTGKPAAHYHSPEVKALSEQAAAEGITAYDALQKFLETQNAWLVTEGPDVPDDAYDDGVFATEAVRRIEELAGGDKPFFLALGFKKPHLPFNAPKKYWDLYDPADIELAPFQQQADDSPAMAYHDGNELRSYSGVPAEGPLPEALQRELIHGYKACVSYVDAQLGRVLKALADSGEMENTVIVLWGDHGWHLGDHGMWAKHSNFEQATRSPLLVVLPGVSGGLQIRNPVEFIDIFPTLTDVAGLETPQDLQGKSLRPMLKDPEVSVKEVAVSQFPRGKYMGYALRDRRYRYVAWMPFDGSATVSAEGKVAEELYDYETDPEERKSLIHDPAAADVLAGMRGRMDDFLTSQGE